MKTKNFSPYENYRDQFAIAIIKLVIALIAIGIVYATIQTFNQ